MSPAPAPTDPNPNPAGDWTIVARRGRRGKHRPHHTIPQPQTLTLTPSSPSPWAPIDPVVDHARVSKLRERMESSIRRLESSRFYRRFLSRLRGRQIQRALARVSPSSGSSIRMVVYGVGSIESYEPPRLQLALALLLRRELGPAAASLEVFDPVLSATECAAAAALGCAVIAVDERGRREVAEPTLFYMPHCEAALYDGLLEANWSPSALNRMVVLGNSFAEYERYVDETAWSRGSAAVEAAARHVIMARKYVEEVPMEEKGEGGDKEGRMEDDEDGIFRAFHDTSWHFFDLDEGTQMDALIA
ncbi:Protein SENSITIVITY TO RED LIGHT REDUCED 1 [Ananas comosus]|uniref:Protein SENSITIVITY TO RED LIGHT REDUCED 1 n=1 Tax=Ananas comosus TaxID=4615 RepID=A0A199W8I0_ANACO|nr:Protein SENSITIVITY TO RED LIGHT REDUCED 1 [Ananas comosus]